MLNEHLTTARIFRIVGLIVFTLIPIIAFVIGMKYQQTKTMAQGSEIIVPTSAISPVEQISPTMPVTNDKEAKQLIETLCQNRQKLNLYGYEDGAVYKCGKYYAIDPSPLFMPSDALRMFFDRSGNYVVACGEKPMPDTFKQNPICKIKCVSLNTKLCTSEIIQKNQTLANPAAVYCEEQGGKNKIVTAPDGSQSGQCIFADGRSCDDWQFFRTKVCN